MVSAVSQEELEAIESLLAANELSEIAAVLALAIEEDVGWIDLS